MLRLSEDLPLVVEVVDGEDKIFLPLSFDILPLR
jgi:PII-like signaling protein